AAADDVLLPRDEIEPAVGIGPHQIAGREPAVAEGSLGLRRVAEIALHQDRRLHPQLADLARRDVAPVLAHDSALGPGPRRIGVGADGPHAAGPTRRLERRRGDTGDLAHAVAADEMAHAELLAKRAGEAVAHAVDGTQAMVGAELASRSR